MRHIKETENQASMQTWGGAENQGKVAQSGSFLKWAPEVVFGNWQCKIHLSDHASEASGKLNCSPRQPLPGLEGLRMHLPNTQKPFQGQQLLHPMV